MHQLISHKARSKANQLKYNKPLLKACTLLSLCYDLLQTAVNSDLLFSRREKRGLASSEFRGRVVCLMTTKVSDERITSIIITSTQKMYGLHSSQTLLTIYKTIDRHNREDSPHRHSNLNWNDRNIMNFICLHILKEGDCFLDLCTCVSVCACVRACACECVCLQKSVIMSPNSGNEGVYQVTIISRHY
jgi:hypothetical protein